MRPNHANYTGKEGAVIFTLKTSKYADKRGAVACPGALDREIPVISMSQTSMSNESKVKTEKEEKNQKIK